MDEEYINNIFSYHPPLNTLTREKHEFVRESVGSLASKLNKVIPDSPEKTLAIRRLQEAMMYANAAIAIHS